MKHLHITRREAMKLVTGAAGLTLALRAPAQQAGVVRVVMPFPAGNPVDAILRKLSEKVKNRTGHAWVVDNKPGAAGIIGTAEVARAKPDGSVLLFTTAGHTTTAVLHRRLPYDAEADFTPITRIDDWAGFLLLVGANSRFRSVQELIAAAKGKPGSVSYASGGVGNSTHILGALLERAAGLKLIHTPYRTYPIPDLIGGHFDMLFWSSANSMQLVQDGKVRALAISGAKRWATLPNVPSFAELGYPEIALAGWSGLFAPAKTPATTVEHLYQSVVEAFRDPELRDYLAKTTGSTVALPPPAEFRASLRAEMESHRRTLVPLGIVME